MTSIKHRLAIALAVMACAWIVPSLAFAGTGASNTTDDPVNGHFCLHGSNSNMDPNDPPAVNCNTYASKSDVYINGGPTNGVSQLSDGYYFFAVLVPGGQQDPNDGAADNLSDAANGGGGDAVSNRVFHVTNGQINSYSGTHAKDNTYQAIDGLLIGLAPFDDTTNSGDVYILATCLLGSSSTVHTVSPSDCKYDAFKVVGPNPPQEGTDLACTKTASGSFTRTFSWTTAKSVTPTYVQTSGTTVTASYSVTFTKSAGVDSGFTVSGTIQCFNTNDTAATSVSVSDVIGTTTCTVTGGSSTIAANDSVIWNYTCPVADASSGTNTANTTWDKTSINSPTGSTTAVANFSFGSPTLVGNCTTVSDTRASQVTGTICATTTFTYTLTLNVPAAGCTDYPNTASETTSGTSASASVRVCRTNSNGYTIGFWQNKNGQSYIGSNCTALRAKVASYSSVFSSVPACTTPFKDYVTSIINAANASGDGVAMFKAQMLATALNVGRTASLGTTGVVVPTSIDADGCATVNQVLASANTYYAAASADSTITSAERAQLLTYKDVFDATNNNNAVTC